MATLLEVPKVEYDLMAVESIDRSTDNIVYRVYEPDVPLTIPANTTTPVNVVYSIRDLGEFFLLSDSYINVIGSFKQADGGDLGVADNPALECASTSFFSQSRLRLNSQLIEDNSTLSHTNAFIRQLTTLSPDYVSTCGANSGFILDENTGAAEDIDYILAAGPALQRNAAFNAGYRRRRAQAGGGEVDPMPTNGQDQLAGVVERSYVVRLSDLFSAANCRKVMKNVSLRVELTTRTQAEMIFQTAGVGEQCKFEISKMQLVIAVHNPALDQLSRMEAELASGQDINYQYLKYTTFESDVGDVSNSAYRSFTFNTSSQKPIAAFLTTQRTKTDAGAEENYNSMVFDNCGLSNVRIKVNGKQYPYSEYESSFSNSRNLRSYARPYEELLRFMSKNYDVNSGALITPEQWSLLYPLYYIPFHNLPPSPSYSLTAEVKSSLTGATAFAAGNARHQQKYKIYLTLLTVGEFTISGDRSGVIVRSQ